MSNNKVLNLKLDTTIANVTALVLNGLNIVYIIKTKDINLNDCYAICVDGLNNFIDIKIEKCQIILMQDFTFNILFYETDFTEALNKAKRFIELWLSEVMI